MDWPIDTLPQNGWDMGGWWGCALIVNRREASHQRPPGTLQSQKLSLGSTRFPTTSVLGPAPCSHRTSFPMFPWSSFPSGWRSRRGSSPLFLRLLAGLRGWRPLSMLSSPRGKCLTLRGETPNLAQLLLVMHENWWLDIIIDWQTTRLFNAWIISWSCRQKNVKYPLHVNVMCMSVVEVLVNPLFYDMG